MPSIWLRYDAFVTDSVPVVPQLTRLHLLISALTSRPAPLGVCAQTHCVGVPQYLRARKPHIPNHHDLDHGAEIVAMAIYAILSNVVCMIGTIGIEADLRVCKLH